eukprot:gene1289-1630_t
MRGAQMQIAPEQGQLLALLVELLGVQKAIEVGVYTGYSSLAVALALPANGRLVAFDRDAKTLAVAQRYWRRASVEGKIQICLGPAISGLQQLLDQEGSESFDMAFIDADKRGYQAYFELCLQLVRPGGLIAVDNVLFYGKVADPAADDKATLSLRAFNDSLLVDQRVSFSIVPIGDGMALCRKI